MFRKEVCKNHVQICQTNIQIELIEKGLSFDPFSKIKKSERANKKQNLQLWPQQSETGNTKSETAAHTCVVVADAITICLLLFLPVMPFIVHVADDCWFSNYQWLHSVVEGVLVMQHTGCVCLCNVLLEDD